MGLNLFDMPLKDKVLCDRRDWEKHLRIERWLLNRSFRTEEWRALLREEAEQDRRDFEAVAKALGCPGHFQSLP